MTFHNFILFMVLNGIDLIHSTMSQKTLDRLERLISSGCPKQFKCSFRGKVTKREDRNVSMGGHLFEQIWSQCFVLIVRPNLLLLNLNKGGFKPTTPLSVHRLML